MTRGVWEARYPDLAGKVALVAGDGDAIVAIAHALAANGSPIGVIAPERAIVDDALAGAADVNAMGVLSDPTDPATWTRVVPHAEQRLGPIDILVVVGTDIERQPAVRAVTPDMGARRRGVVVEVGEPGDLLPLPDEVRHRVVSTVGNMDGPAVASAVAFCVSDVLAVPVAQVRLGVLV